MLDRAGHQAAPLPAIVRTPELCVAHADYVLPSLLADDASFLCEVPPAQAAAFEKALDGVPQSLIGNVEDSSRLVVHAAAAPLIDALEAPVPSDT